MIGASPGRRASLANQGPLLQSMVRLALGPSFLRLPTVDLSYVPQWSGSDVIVEDYIGLEYHDARTRALQLGLWLRFADPDHPPTGMCIVTDQNPAAGTEVVRRTEVRVWVKDVPEDPTEPLFDIWPGEGNGPSGGVREPRRPLPGHDDGSVSMVEGED